MSLSCHIRTTFRAPGANPFPVDAALALEPGETLVVLGPSGSGKTLLLEALAGFHRHDGWVRVDGGEVTHSPPEARGLGYVFQDYALFPHLAVEANVAFGRRFTGGTGEIEALLRRLGIDHLRRRLPPSLSGGEQQRVALARALAVEPRVMLLDEPLSSLDRPTHEALRHDLLALLRGVSAVLVTHDRDEARMLGDRVAVMRAGRIVQSGSVGHVFDDPADGFVARFLGYGQLPVAHNRDHEARLCLRPEAIGLTGVDDGRLEARVSHIVAEGAAYRVGLIADGTPVDALTLDPPAAGERVGIDWSDRDARWVVPAADTTSDAA